MHQMGLGIKADPIASRAQHRIEHRGDRTLALGARNMHRAQLPMRVADQRERIVHAIELVDLAARFQRVQPFESIGHPLHLECESLSRRSILRRIESAGLEHFESMGAF